MSQGEPSDGAAPAAHVEQQQRLIDAAALVTDGESAVVVVETPDGSASTLVEMVPDDLALHSRVRCGPASRARVGGVAEDLAIEEFPGGTMVLEDAQWADPTSLGRLQRLVREGSHPFLLIVAHRPLSDVDGWWLGLLALAANRHANLVEITLEESESVSAATPLDSRSKDLIVATSLVTGSISVPVAGQLIGVEEAELFEIGDTLIEAGLLGQTRAGYVSTPESAAAAGGEARIGYVADRLAAAMEEAGGDPAVIGGLRLAAGQPAQAFPVLTKAARDASRRNATGEAYHLAEAALRAADEADLADGSEIGELHLISGHFLRSAGRTELAAGHLEKATTRLEGIERVDALELSATIADDGQNPQNAERIIATAEWEASRLGESTRLGSLLSFHAKVLNRIGFADEADAALDKGRTLLGDDATAAQVFDATVNKAWIHFDRGEAALAGAEFTRLRDDAGPLEGDASVADKEAWRARALFASGDPAAALMAVEVAEHLATEEDVEAPLFISQLALTEGGLDYGHYDEALDASGWALDLVERQFHAWENMVRSLRATAYLRLGRTAEASEEIARALEASPEGANGWRWRTRCRALQMEITAASGGRWPAKEAEDLADLMLQSRLYGWAAELMTAIAEHNRRKGSAAEAMALAARIGRPMLAARAAQAGGLWNDPAAGTTVMAIRAIEERIPTGWEEAWRSLPHTEGALAAPEPRDGEDVEAATAALDVALHKAGLAGDEVLSPAQRRHGGLVRKPRFHPLRLLAATLGIVVVAGGTAVGVAAALRPPEVIVPTTAPPVTQPLTIEQTQLELPAGALGFFGTAMHRGDQGRSGYVDIEGLKDVTGFYWKVPTAAPIDAAPVAFGQNLYVATTEGTVYILDLDDGRELWTLPPAGRISAAPALGQADFGQGVVPEFFVVVSESGVVRGQEATKNTAIPWSKELGGKFTSSPVIVDGVVIVANSEGFVYGLNLQDGEILWSYRGDDDAGIGPVSADLAYADGVLYVGTTEGELHLLDVTSGSPTEICVFDARDAIAVNPIVVDGVTYVSTTAGNIWTLPAGTCARGEAPNRQPVYVSETPVDVAPAIVGDVMYLPTGRFLYTRDLTTNQPVWEDGSVAADSPISAPPVVDRDTVYFASQDGVVHAVDRTTGVLRWPFKTDLHVRGAPLVLDGVVYVVSADRFIYALGDGNPPDK